MKIRYFVFMNAEPTGIIIEGDDKLMDCGCLLNADMTYGKAQDAIRDAGLFPDGHVWVGRGCNCPNPTEDNPTGEAAYGAGEVKVLPGGVGFVWLESRLCSSIPGCEEDEE